MPALMKPGALTPWMTFFKTLLDFPVPEALGSYVDDANEIDTRNKHIFWKIKALAGRVTYRMFCKFARMDFLPPEELDFAKAANDEFSGALLESHL
jgi:hypothetical protein